MREIQIAILLRMPPNAPLPAKDHSLTKLEHFKVFREYRMREHDLLNHRISWNLSVQGFLFATYGFSLQKLTEIETSVWIDGSHATNGGVQQAAQVLGRIKLTATFQALTDLVYAIPWVGLGLALFTWLSVWGAWVALRMLEKQWDGGLEGLRKAYPAEPVLPSPTGAGSQLAVWLGLFPPLGLPPVFIIAWAVLLVRLPH